MSEEIVTFYYEYVEERPQIKRAFPNVVIWIDAIIFRVDCGDKSCLILRDYSKLLKLAKKIIERQNKFSRCEKYQQSILCDMDKLKTSENGIVIQILLIGPRRNF